MCVDERERERENEREREGERPTQKNCIRDPFQASLEEEVAGATG
jgi:hypothetical protein